jgi:hypothetical protein
MLVILFALGGDKMKIEVSLKEYILTKYKSVREFCMMNDFPYSTVNNIFSRGITGSSVSVIIKVCDRLGIDVDELVNGKIVEKAPPENFDALTVRYSRLDDADRERVLSYIDGILSGDKYIVEKERRA